LSGREILRAKLLGSIWKVPRAGVLMLALWMLGLLSGAVHPLGFIAALTGMIVSCVVPLGPGSLRIVADPATVSGHRQDPRPF
jgi:hypothetical protein